jgi:hypothetical protein
VTCCQTPIYLGEGESELFPFGEDVVSPGE